MTKGYAPAGADRGVNRLGVTAVEARDVVPAPAGAQPGPPGPTVAVGQSLREALAALLESGSGSVDVVDGDGARLGILTLQALNVASRRSADGDRPGVLVPETHALALLPDPGTGHGGSGNRAPAGVVDQVRSSKLAAVVAGNTLGFGRR